MQTFLLAALVAMASGLAASPEREALTARGRVLFVDQGCIGCHTLGKAGTPIAPDLSRVGFKYGEARLIRWLRDPTAQKPTAHMPVIALTEAEVRALAAYLASLR